MYTVRVCQNLKNLSCQKSRNLYSLSSFIGIMSSSHQAQQQEQPRSIFARLFKGKNKSNNKYKGGSGSGRFGQYNLLSRVNAVNTLSSTGIGDKGVDGKAGVGGTKERAFFGSEALTSNQSQVEDGGVVGRVHIERSGGLPVKIGYESSAGYELQRVPGVTASTRTRKMNQDAYCVLSPFDEDRGQLFVGVFDGHGMHGTRVSQKIRDSLVELLPGLKQVDEADEEVSVQAVRRDRRRMLCEAFERAERGLVDMGEDEDLDHCYSGAATVCVWMIGRELYCAWAGDSRCIVGRRVQSKADGGSDDEKSSSTFRAIAMTEDHKPNRADEQKRVRAAGGRIMRWQKHAGPLRVWMPDDWIPGLAMTRSIGDTLMSEYGVIPEPEVSHMQLNDDDSFLVVASDGIWEFLTNDEVVRLVGKMRGERAKPRDTAKVLVQEAVRRWRQRERVVDDITAVVVYFNFNGPDANAKRHVGSKPYRKRLSGSSSPQLLNEHGELVPFKTYEITV